MEPTAQKLLTGAAGAAGEKVYVEDVFSTWLYTGNGSTQTITNGIDLAGKGGLVWYKSRNNAVNNALFDTARGAGKLLISDTTDEEGTGYGQSFTSSGFSLTNGGTFYNGSGYTYASWTFRKAAKFFDVVTYTGDGTNNRAINHSLGSVPGFIIVKSTSATGFWICYHRSLGSGNYLILNLTNASNDVAQAFSSVTSTSFVPTSDANAFSLNDSGVTYVAYLFAHDAGGFGDSGSDSVVSCGSFTTDGSGNATVTLGWEPQWVLAKRSDASQTWWIGDVMRGMTGSATAQLYPNAPDAEFSNTSFLTAPTATGFTAKATASATYIYIAIRRGPMKTPTSGTEVFSANLGTSSSVVPTFVTNFPVDLAIFKTGRAAVTPNYTPTRLTNSYLNTTSTAVEAINGSTFSLQSNTGWGTSYSNSAVSWNFRRAPGFFDVVAYTGSSGASPIYHNLGVEPELIICKVRNTTYTWPVYVKPIAGGRLILESNVANTSSGIFGTVTSTLFTVGGPGGISSSDNGIAYLFATCPGVSKVGSYTGTGTTLNIDCDFTSGARFVLIKRTDSTGDWYVWDTARGIVSGNDPYLLLNSAAAEVTSTDYIDPLSSGFQISSTAPAAINANGGSFVFLAIS